MKLQYNFPIKRWIVIGLSVLVLACSTGCARKKSFRATRQGTTSSSNVKNLHISAIKVAGQNNHITIKIKPNRVGTVLENYFITAKVITGQGQLWGAKEKVKKALQYEIPLDDRSLVDLWPSQGDVTKFCAGKSIDFRCNYEPQAEAKEGDTHQLAITVIQKDEEGRSIREAQTELTFKPKQLHISAIKVAGQNNHVKIKIKPNRVGTVLENYFITAKVITGQGQLWGAKEKVKKALQYEIPLDDRSLVDLWSSQGDVTKFCAGKSIDFRCNYEPQAEAKEGDTHQLAITVTQKDEEGRSIREAQTELTFKPKQLHISAIKVAGQNNHVKIKIKPNRVGTVLENYFITAKVITGQGQLWGAKEKVKKALQYEIPLDDRSLVDLWSSQGDVTKFCAGKSIDFRCNYEPQVEAKEGDTYQLAITVTQKDKEGRAIREAQTELTLAVK